jgi:transposase
VLRLSRLANNLISDDICCEERISFAWIGPQLDPLVKETAPTLVSRLGIETGHGGQLLITAGQNIGQLHSEAAFARLCGVVPIRVSSGHTHRMRLHCGGDRQANRAHYMIAVCWLRYDPRTIDYMSLCLIG